MRDLFQEKNKNFFKEEEELTGKKKINKESFRN